MCISLMSPNKYMYMTMSCQFSALGFCRRLLNHIHNSSWGLICISATPEVWQIYLDTHLWKSCKIIQHQAICMPEALYYYYLIFYLHFSLTNQHTLDQSSDAAAATNCKAIIRITRRRGCNKFVKNRMEWNGMLWLCIAAPEHRGDR